MTQRIEIDGADSHSWLTVKQAAEYAGVSVSTILRWEKRGHIKAHRTPSNHRRFVREEVAALFTKAAS